MTNEEIDNFINNWFSSERKVFTYKRDFMPLEYVILIKRIEDNLGVFFQIGETSTYHFNDSKLYLNEFKKLFNSGQLSFYQNDNWNLHPVLLKTGGCTCGGWALRESERAHAKNCAIYVKP